MKTPDKQNSSWSGDKTTNRVLLRPVNLFVVRTAGIFESAIHLYGFLQLTGNVFYVTNTLWRHVFAPICVI